MYISNQRHTSIGPGASSNMKVELAGISWGYSHDDIGGGGGGGGGGVQWNLSNPDTLGMEESVLFIEVSSFQGVLIRGVPL